MHVYLSVCEIEDYFYFSFPLPFPTNIKCVNSHLSIISEYLSCRMSGVSGCQVYEGWAESDCSIINFIFIRNYTSQNFLCNFKIELTQIVVV